MGNVATLKGLREQARLQQADLAKLLGIQQSRVSRIEADPGTLPSTILASWARALGVGVEELLAAMGPDTPLDVQPLEPDPSAIHKLHAQLQEAFAALGQLEHSGARTLDGPADGRPLETLLRELGRLPRLAVFGQFDAGKSTLLNSLLGADILPAGYRPMTNAVTLLRHLDQRPAWMGEFEVVMLNTTLRSDQIEEEIEPERIVLRTHTDVLTVRGHHDAEVPRVAMIVAYVDSELLRSCEVVDLPGFGHTTRDDELAVGFASEASVDPAVAPDVVLYLSPIAGFLNAEDVHQLRGITDRIGLSRLAGHLAVVATHVHPHVEDQELEAAIESGRSRLSGQRDNQDEEPQDSPTAAREEPDEDLVPEFFDAPFFSFFREDPRRSESLWNWLEGVLSTTLPAEVKAAAAKATTECRESALRWLDDTAKALQDTSTEGDFGDEVDTDELQESVEAARTRLSEAISGARRRSEEAWKDHATSVVDVEHVKKVLKSAEWNRKEAAQRLPERVMSQLTRKLNSIVESETKVVLEEVESVLGDIETKLESMDASLRLRSAGFDPRGAFAGGLAGAVTVGGLAAWAATMGNLGAYILVAKGVSALSAVGISVGGGTAGAIGAVSAIGGPATLAIGMVVVGALTGLALTGAGWQGRMAKQLVAEFEKQRIVSQLTISAGKYWTDTQEAAMRALSAVGDELNRASVPQGEDRESVLLDLRRRREIWEAVAIPS